MKHVTDDNTHMSTIAVRVISYVIASLAVGTFADLTLVHAAGMLI